MLKRVDFIQKAVECFAFVLAENLLKIYLISTKELDEKI